MRQVHLHMSENDHHDSAPDARRSSRYARRERQRTSGSGGAHSSVSPAAAPPDSEGDLSATRQSRTQNSIGRPRRPSAFLNIPFRPSYEPICIALISGLTCLGITPRLVTQIRGSKVRLTKLKRLIRACDYSFHDLSYIGRDSYSAPDGARRRVPGFNMPFECGLTIGLTGGSKHQWYVLEKVPYRAQVSLSDLNGWDPLIHSGKPSGIHRALLRVLARRANPPSPSLLHRVYLGVFEVYLDLKGKHGVIFESPDCFKEVVWTARALWIEEQEHAQSVLGPSQRTKAPQIRLNRR